MKVLLLVGCCFFCLSFSGQQTVSGIIKDKVDSTPLSGATIQVKGMEHIGTFTKEDGMFNLLIPEGEATTLVISYLGYHTIEMPAEECNNATIFLDVSTTFLNEAVVVGYGTQVRSDMTGNVAKIKKEVIGGTSGNSCFPRRMVF